MAEQQTWLDKMLVPQAKGDFRIGAKLFDEKLAFTLNSSLTRKEIRARAEAAVTKTRAEMRAVARQGAAQRPGKPVPDSEQQIIQAALDIAVADRPARERWSQTAKARWRERPISCGA